MSVDPTVDSFDFGAVNMSRFGTFCRLALVFAFGFAFGFAFAFDLRTVFADDAAVTVEFARD